jgi:hypothetical protein
MVTPPPREPGLCVETVEGALQWIEKGEMA